MEVGLIHSYIVFKQIQGSLESLVTQNKLECTFPIVETTWKFIKMTKISLKYCILAWEFYILFVPRWENAVLIGQKKKVNVKVLKNKEFEPWDLE